MLDAAWSAQQQLIDETEYRGVGTDPQSERERHGRCERRRAAQLT